MTAGHPLLVMRPKDSARGVSPSRIQRETKHRLSPARRSLRRMSRILHQIAVIVHINVRRLPIR
jgi:hypothetical protein